MDMKYRGGMWEGGGGQDGVECGGEWDNCNSVINKYIFLKKNLQTVLPTSEFSTLVGDNLDVQVFVFSVCQQKPKRKWNLKNDTIYNSIRNLNVSKFRNKFNQKWAEKAMSLWMAWSNSWLDLKRGKSSGKHDLQRGTKNAQF